MLKITVTTDELKLTLEDDVVVIDGYTKHTLPETVPAVKAILEEVLKASVELAKLKSTVNLNNTD
jgi:hypothetical protein